MKTPLFSVLISNYNNGCYLLEALNSIYDQTYSNWEVIIVDDCSTDESKKIYETLAKDSRIKIFYNDNNRGVGYTKHKCIDYANGEICGFLDPDDALVPNALEKMVLAHQNNVSAGLIYSEAIYCDSQLNIINSIQRHFPITKENYLFEDNYIVGHFATFKKDSYLKTPGLNMDYKRAVDQDLYYLLEEVSDLKYLNEFLYYYRIHDRGVSSVGLNIVKAFSWHIAVIIDTCKRRNIPFEDIVSRKIDIHMRRSGAEELQLELDKIKCSRSYKIGRSISKILYPIARLFR